MKLTIEVSSQSELEKIIFFFQTLKLEGVRIVTETPPTKLPKNNKKAVKVTKGDKSLDPSDLFGMWKDTPRDLENLRRQAWQRDVSF